MAMAINVCATNSNANNLSRKAMLAWVNETLATSYQKIEELSSGAAYCNLMNLLFPHSINPTKIKDNSIVEYDHINNWKMLQNAFVKVKVEKGIPINSLIKSHFQDNFEFLQWFMKFYDANTNNNNDVFIDNDIKENCEIVAAPTSPGAALIESFECLTVETEEFEGLIDAVKIERNFYYEKLRKIEDLCRTAIETDPMAVKFISALYTPDS